MLPCSLTCQRLDLPVLSILAWLTDQNSLRASALLALVIVIVIVTVVVVVVVVVVVNQANTEHCEHKLLQVGPWQQQHEVTLTTSHSTVPPLKLLSLAHLRVEFGQQAFHLLFRGMIFWHLCRSPSISSTQHCILLIPTCLELGSEGFNSRLDGRPFQSFPLHASILRRT